MESERLAGRPVRPTFERLELLFDTDVDLRKRLGISPSGKRPKLEQALLRERLYENAQERDLGDNSPESTDASRYREVAVRRFVLGDPDAVSVGWDLLEALPLRDDEKAYVLGLKPQYIVPPEGQQPGSFKGPTGRIRQLATRFVEAGMEDVEAIARFADPLIDANIKAIENAIRRRFERGTEKAFVLHGSCLGKDGTREIRACIRMWLLHPGAVLGIRQGHIRSGADIGDQEHEVVEFEEPKSVDEPNLVADPNLVAGVYLPLLAGKSELAGAAAVYWMRDYLMDRFPSRAVFTRPTNKRALRAVERVGGQKVGGRSSEIYELCEFPK